MKQYKVYLNDIKWKNLKNDDGKVVAGGVSFDGVFYDSVKYENISKISEEVFWYLVNENLQHQLEQYKNIIKEVREYIENKEIDTLHFNSKDFLDTSIAGELLEILDKVGD